MVWKEFTIMTRYPVEFFASFGQVFLIVAVFVLAGLTFTVGAGSGPADETYAGVVLYGFIMFMFMSDTFWTIGYNVRRDQVQGTLEQLYLSPANKFFNLLSRITTIMTWTGLISLAGGWLMATMLGVLPFHNPVMGFVYFFFTISGTFGLGFAFAALTLRIKETANSLANILQFVLMVFCAIFFPFSALPEPVLWVSRVLPLAHGVDLVRSTFMGYPEGFPELYPVSVEAPVVIIFGLVMPFIGLWLYRLAENSARVRGSLAEF